MVGKAAAEDKVACLVAYVLTWLTGLIVFLITPKERKKVRFHAMQAILLGIVSVLLLWTFIGPLLIWLYGLYIGYQEYSAGVTMEVPVLGAYAHKFAEG